MNAHSTEDFPVTRLPSDGVTVQLETNENDWPFHNVAESDSMWGLAIPSDAEILDGQCHIFLEVYNFGYGYAEATFILGGHLHSVSAWQGSRQHEQISYPVAPGGYTSDANNITFFVTSDPVPSSQIACKIKKFKLECRYRQSRPFYPKKEHKIDSLTVLVNSNVFDETVNPADLINSLFTMRGQGIDTGDTWGWYFQRGYAFRGLIPGEMTINAAIRAALEQCRSFVMHTAGGIRLNVSLPRADTEPVGLLGPHEIKQGGIAVTQQSITDCINRMSVSYGKDSITGSYSGATTSENATSISRYGERKKDIDGYLIFTEEHAQDLGDFVVGESAYPLALLTATTFSEGFPYDVGDKVSIETNYAGIGR